MSNQVITIGYLKDFVGDVVKINSSYTDMSYCPTYAELTNGDLVLNFKDNTSPLSIVNGIYVNPNFTSTSTYANNQLVIREHLQLKYAELQSISVSATKTSISCCGESTTLSATGYFKVVTKSEGGSLVTSTTQTSQAVSATYSDSASYTTINGSKITFNKNSVNYPSTNTAAARTVSVNGSYTYTFNGGKSITKTNTVNITQSANNVGSWVNTSTSTNSIGVSPTSMSFASGGGSKSYTVTRYYTQYQEKYDSCSVVMDTNNYNTSSVVTPTTAVASGDFDCTKTTVSIGVNSGALRTGTLTVTYDGKTATCSLSQAASQAGIYNGEPYDYSYDLSVTVASSYVGCDGGTATFQAYYITSWKYDWEEKDASGNVINSGTSNDSDSVNVTNSATWSTNLGSVNKGILTLGAYSLDARRTATVTASYNGYSDSNTAYQESCYVNTSCMKMSYVTTNLNKTITISYQLTNGTQEGTHSVSQNGTQEMCFGNIGQTTLRAVCNDSEIELSGDIEFTYDYPSNDIKTIYVTQKSQEPDVDPCKCIRIVYGSQPFCYNQNYYNGAIRFDRYEGNNCQSFVEGSPANTITLITNGSGCNLQGGTIEYNSNQTGETLEYKWVGSNNTSANSRYITFIATSSTFNCSGTCTLEQYGTAHTECDPQENCMSYMIGNNTSKSATIRIYTLNGNYDNSVTVQGYTTTDPYEICDLTDGTKINVSMTSGNGELNMTSFNFKKGDQKVIEVSEITAPTEPTCNTPSGTFAGDYDFRVDFSEAVASDVTVYIDEKDGECNVVKSFEVTVSKGKKTGYGYDVLDQNHGNVVAAYFEITSVSPSSDDSYYYWGNGCDYDDSGDCSNTEPTCTTSNTWNSISANVSADECTTSPTVSVTASGTHTNTDCTTSTTSTTLSSSNYTIKYGTTSGSYTLDNITQNTGSTSKTWYYKVTASSAYGNKTTTGSFTQAGGCVVSLSSRTEYDIQVLDASIEACSTSASPTVQGRSRTVNVYSDGSTTNGSWGSWSNISNTYYNLSYSPSIGKNETSSVKTYTVTATGKGTYAGESATGTITQSAGPCTPIDITGSTTEYEMQVLDTTVDKCATTAPSITVQGRSRTGKTHTNGTATEWGSWGSWSNLSSSDYTLDVPTISKNTGSTSKSYTVTATGKGKYASESATGTITQPGGCEVVKPKITVTFTGGGGILNWLSGGGDDYGCSGDGSLGNEYELYLPQAIWAMPNEIDYTVSVSDGSSIPSDLKIVVESQRFHLGHERKGSTSFTPSSSGSLPTPSCTENVADDICKQVEQDCAIVYYWVDYDGDAYELDVNDLVTYEENGL